jgi:phenylpropionate dioxygenase-like ring-hydroxylating dioxygenase large terminal subunit
MKRSTSDLEMERLWPHVWQIACREEEIATVGDFVEYAIGAFFNACLDRGTRLAQGHGRFDGGAIRCPYHGWCYALDGRLRAVPDQRPAEATLKILVGKPRAGSVPEERGKPVPDPRHKQRWRA